MVLDTVFLLVGIQPILKRLHCCELAMFLDYGVRDEHALHLQTVRGRRMRGQAGVTTDAPRNDGWHERACPKTAWTVRNPPRMHPGAGHAHREERSVEVARGCRCLDTATTCGGRVGSSCPTREATGADASASAGGNGGSGSGDPSGGVVDVATTWPSSGEGGGVAPRSS